jgi:RNA polymerase sigma-70 factor (ECF subfamily)
MSSVEAGSSSGRGQGLACRENGEFSQFCEEVYPKLFAFACAQVDLHDAEELVQETFVQFIGQVEKGIPIASPTGLLFTILRRQISHHWRTCRLSPTTDPKRIEDEPAKEPDALTRLLQEEEHRRLVDAIHFLPEIHREVIYLRYYAGLSTKQIALIPGIPVGTVKQRLYAARQESIRRLGSH